MIGSVTTAAFVGAVAVEVVSELAIEPVGFDLIEGRVVHTGVHLRKATERWAEPTKWGGQHQETGAGK